MPDPNKDAGQPPIEITIEDEAGFNGWACCPKREGNFEMGIYPAYLAVPDWDHEPLKVAGHEFFHVCQYAHPGTPPNKWVREGHARMSQDKFSDWLDH
ncbi:MAG: hypothetical protein ACTSPQ_21385, partial [Candidatus Helarchaeota archaeon]